MSKRKKQPRTNKNKVQVVTFRSEDSPCKETVRMINHKGKRS